jgi:hypothetical protein
LNQSVKPNLVESSTPLQKEDLIGAKHVDGWVKIEKGWSENTVVVHIKPRGKVWTSTRYEDMVEDAFEVETWKVRTIGVVKIGRELTLLIKVEDTRLVE